MPSRPERLYQARFDEHFQFSTPQDVTPEGFTGFEFPRAQGLNPAEHRLGRFVREVREEVQVKSPEDAAQHLLTKVYVPFKDFDQEELWVLLLDTKLQITHEAMIYGGTINAVSIREAELLKEAVRVNSPSLIISHVHASGDPTPSPVIWRKMSNLIDQLKEGYGLSAGWGFYRYEEKSNAKKNAPSFFAWNFHLS